MDLSLAIRNKAAFIFRLASVFTLHALFIIRSYLILRLQKSFGVPFPQVVGAIDFAKEFSDSFRKMASDAIKEERQRAKAAAQERRVSELKRLRHVLRVNRVFRVLTQSSVKRDLLAGANGAPLLSESELEALTEVAATVRLGGGDDDDEGDDSEDSWDVAAECFQALLEGSGGRKTGFGLSYGAVREVLDKIVESGYCEGVKVVVVDASTTTIPLVDSSEERSESGGPSQVEEKGEFSKESSEEG